MTAKSTDVKDRPFCDGAPQSEALVGYNEETGEEHIEVLDEGYECPNFAVGRYEIETHAGPTMEFDGCEQHAERWEDDGVLVSVVERYVDADTDRSGDSHE